MKLVKDPLEQTTAAKDLVLALVAVGGMVF